MQASIFYKIEPHFSRVIEEAFHKLLNSKHLYQSIRMNLPEEKTLLETLNPDLMSMFGKVDNTVIKLYVDVFNYALGVGWYIEDPNRRRLASRFAGEGVKVEGSITIVLQTIRSYCQNCGDIEPYNYVQGNDVLREFPFDHPTSQVFALVFRCQGCKELPEVFLVRREDNKLTLCGRAPIKQILVAPQIPKPHNKYISDATLAFNSGQTLAGIFLLRTFVEQYVRSKSNTPVTVDIDALFSEYGATLLNEFKTHFPSLKSIYDNLSTALHAADPSEPIFSKAKEEIEHHFEGKRAFRITD